MISNIYLQEYVQRKSDALSVIPFGIPFLDDALNGIRPPEIVVIAARTGAGKTEVAAHIALNAAALGKQVTLFALEAEQWEIERRLKYRILSKRFFENRKQYPEHLRLNFNDWLHDKFPELEALEIQVAEEMPLLLTNLNVYSPTVSEFTRKDFAEVYADAVKESQLIVLDHIHYISQLDSENENVHIKRTMSTIRDLVNKHRVPLVAVSHLRKEDKHDKSILPTLSELHGSSDISKQANHVIALGPCWSAPSKDDYKKLVQLPIGFTAWRILKTRSGHSGAERYIALSKFDLETKTYGDTYIPYTTDKHGTQLFPMQFSSFEVWQGRARESSL